MNSRPKLLVLELWGVGDLAIASPFVRKAVEHYDVTLVAKSYASDLQNRFWPPIKVVPFNAPWTAFAEKYRLLTWPWRDMFSLLRKLRHERFEVALSARWDPRVHLLLRLTGAKTRLGFPRTGSQIFLTNPLKTPDPIEHRYESWRVIARALELELEERGKIRLSPAAHGRAIFVHTGAGQPVRVWPLERYQSLVKRLRRLGHEVRVVCNPEQRDWWIAAGEKEVATPRTITELLDLMTGSGVFIGNDSGPGHLAAFSGIPTFTFFGPQLYEWFVPLHPAAEWLEGKPCPYKPCSDYCQFPAPICLREVGEDEALPRVLRFVEKNLKPA
jgi:heptosyltransferase-2